MSEKILSALDAITRVVMSYRPADKGLASAKIARRVKRGFGYTTGAMIARWLWRW